MEFGLFDGGEDGEHNGDSFVEIAKYLRYKRSFFNGAHMCTTSQRIMQSKTEL